MKRICIAFLITTLFISCGNRNGDSFSNDYLLNQFGNIRIPVYKSISEPAMDSEDSYWYAVDDDKRVLYRRDINGNILDQITLYLFPSVQNIDNIYMGTDVDSALFTISTGDDYVRDLCRLTFNSSDHSFFQLDGSASYLVPNPSSLSITDLAEPWGNQVAYLGTYYDTLTSSATQNVYIYDYGTGTTQAVNLDPGIYSFNLDGELIGNYYERIDAYPNSELPNVISSFIISQRIVRADSVSYTIKIIFNDGSIDFDATGIYEYQEIGGIRWLSQEEVLLAARKDGIWQILSINSAGRERVFYKGNSDIYSMDGLSLSPSKGRCLTKIRYHEYDSYSEILILSLQ